MEYQHPQQGPHSIEQPHTCLNLIHLDNISSVMQLFALLDSCRLCMGNSEQKFQDVARHCESIQQRIGVLSSMK